MNTTINVCDPSEHYIFISEYISNTTKKCAMPESMVAKGVSIETYMQTLLSIRNKCTHTIRKHVCDFPLITTEKVKGSEESLNWTYHL